MQEQQELTRLLPPIEELTVLEWVLFATATFLALVVANLVSRNVRQHREHRERVERLVRDVETQSKFLEIMREEYAYFVQNASCE